MSNPFMQPMDSAPAFGGGGLAEEPSRMQQVAGIVRGLKHPITAFFHLFFKTLAILAYMFGGLFSVGFVNLFIVCILLLAFDFWTVKNVSGRLMVGLRWWSEVQEDGTTVWRYESQSVRQLHSPRPRVRLAAFLRTSAPRVRPSCRASSRDERQRSPHRTLMARHSTTGSSGGASSCRRWCGASSRSALSSASASTGCCSF